MSGEKFNDFLDNLFDGEYDLLLKQINPQKEVGYGIVEYKGFKVFISGMGQINKIEEIVGDLDDLEEEEEKWNKVEWL